jgi:hypothetical protein
MTNTSSFLSFAILKVPADEDEPGDTRSEKLAWLEKLIPVRNVLMHPRRPLSIRESWAIEVGSMRVAALTRKLGVFGASHSATQ